MIGFARAGSRGVSDRLRAGKGPEGFARRLDVRLSGRVRCHGITRGMFNSEPWSITLGDNVYITAGVTIVTHDGGTLILRLEQSDLEWTAPIVVKDDVDVGVQAVRLPGGTTGRPAIVAAGAVVARNVPTGSVVGGVPRRHIRTTDECLGKMRAKSLKLGHRRTADKERELRTLVGRES